MAKFCGFVGFCETIETSPDVFSKVETRKKYYGDVLRNTRRWERTEHLNDDLNVSNKISIIADPYAFEKFAFIRYVEWNNVKWKVSDVDIERPRLILTIGGVYNEEQDADS